MEERRSWEKRDLLLLLSFLDTFDNEGEIKFENINRLEYRFLTTLDISQLQSSLLLLLSNDDEEHEGEKRSSSSSRSSSGITINSTHSAICLFDSKVQTKLIRPQIDELKNKIISELTSSSPLSSSSTKFDYQQQVKEIIVELLTFLQPFIPPPQYNELQKIECNVVQNTGEEWSIGYEVGYAAGGLEIAYPNPYSFTSHHQLEVLRRGYISDMKRLEIDFFYWSYISVVHEAIHCLQSVFNYNNEAGWILEHDASRLQLLLTSYLLPRLSYPQSMSEACALHHYRTINNLLRLMNDNNNNDGGGGGDNNNNGDDNNNGDNNNGDDRGVDVMIEKYRRWRDSLGQIAISDEEDTFAYNQSHLLEMIFIKQRVALETYCNSYSTSRSDDDSDSKSGGGSDDGGGGDHLSDLLHYLCHHRYLSSSPPSPPSHLQIRDEATFENHFQSPSSSISPNDITYLLSLYPPLPLYN